MESSQNLQLAKNFPNKYFCAVENYMVTNQRQRYSIAYCKEHTALMFYYYYYYFSPEVLHIEGVVVKMFKGGSFDWKLRVLVLF
jgi:hypothetical protein